MLQKTSPDRHLTVTLPDGYPNLLHVRVIGIIAYFHLFCALVRRSPGGSGPGIMVNGQIFASFKLKRAKIQVKLVDLARPGGFGNKINNNATSQVLALAPGASPGR